MRGGFGELRFFAPEPMRASLSDSDVDSRDRDGRKDSPVDSRDDGERYCWCCPWCGEWKGSFEDSFECRRPEERPSRESSGRSSPCGTARASPTGSRWRGDRSRASEGACRSTVGDEAVRFTADDGDGTYAEGDETLRLCVGSPGEMASATAAEFRRERSMFCILDLFSTPCFVAAWERKRWWKRDRSQ